MIVDRKDIIKESKRIQQELLKEEREDMIEGLIEIFDSGITERLEMGDLTSPIIVNLNINTRFRYMEIRNVLVEELKTYVLKYFKEKGYDITFNDKSEQFILFLTTPTETNRKRILRKIEIREFLKPFPLFY